MDMNLSKLWEIKKDRDETDVLQSMGSQRVRYDLVTEQQLTALNPRFTIVTDTLHNAYHVLGKNRANNKLLWKRQF